MNIQDFQDGLSALGFTGGYAIGGDPAEIILWENDAPQPSDSAIAKAAKDGAFQREYDAVTIARAAAYAAVGGSDGIFFQYQRGEKTEQEWLDAVQAINDANPYPVKAK